jgi:hypothetical protein
MSSERDSADVRTRTVINVLAKDHSIKAQVALMQAQQAALNANQGPLHGAKLQNTAPSPAKKGQ